ncbi:MAG TPA: hypothetical protein VN897_19080, partial [Mycobacterium sp.]|nr:hypothetical protein [Mycobacterium sp.]
APVTTAHPDPSRCRFAIAPPSMWMILLANVFQEVKCRGTTDCTRHGVADEADCGTEDGPYQPEV